MLSDVQEKPLLKQMQAADSCEAEMEAESPGGIPFLECVFFLPSLLTPPLLKALTVILVQKLTGPFVLRVSVVSSAWLCVVFTSINDPTAE